MHILLTNNSRLAEEAGAKMVSGSFRDVLLAARDYVYVGHALITHPLFASAGMMFSPIRSILISEEKTKDSIHAEMIANAISDYDKMISLRGTDEKNRKDYERIDEELYRVALEEHQRFNLGG
ncbi:MAG: hypothetical protein GX046_06160 [Tissierellia bacterium]|jgi:hypothetical protein|nr:hypothetical protein [Tissierellia bacterium]